MAWNNIKQWFANMIPSSGDFNRIEGNTLDNHNRLDGHDSELSNHDSTLTNHEGRIDDIEDGTTVVPKAENAIKIDGVGISCISGRRDLLSSYFGQPPFEIHAGGGINPSPIIVAFTCDNPDNPGIALSYTISERVMESPTGNLYGSIVKFSGEIPSEMEEFYIRYAIFFVDIEV